jgi:hypothetical protein
LRRLGAEAPYVDPSSGDYCNTAESHSKITKCSSHSAASERSAR